MKKTAVVLFNLGGPDSLAAVEPFLFNLFNDAAIIRLPKFFRFLIAKLISSRRAETAQAIYAKIGGSSPILKNTIDQARALESALGEGAKCFICMRYWHPFTAETAAEVKAYAPEEIILLPLYPQFSTTTTASSLDAWRLEAKRAGITAPTKMICCYPKEDGFIAPMANAVKAAYAQAANHGKVRVLFSAHGLPEKIVAAGDPYRWQCERTAKILAETTNIPGLDWVLCYQSRVGPLKWIGPSTEDEIRRAGADKLSVVVAPVAFVSEHSETLVEIDMDYRELAQKCGSPFFAYAPAVGTAPQFIEGLARLVRKAQDGGDKMISEMGRRICPPQFPQCCQKSR